MDLSGSSPARAAASWEGSEGQVDYLRPVVAPTEADIRMMAFSFREFTNFLNKGKRLPEIAKLEAALDAASFIRQLPVRGLRMKELSCSRVSGGIPPR